MRLFTTLFAVFIALQISAQAVLNPYDGFTIGEYYYLLADAVNLRALPDTKADLVCKIPIGTEIKVLEKSAETLLLNGIRAPWYKIAFYENGLAKSGYIWGGFIALYRLTDGANEETSFLIGIEKAEKDMEFGMTQTYYTFQMRACHKQKELARIAIAVGENINYGISSKISTNRGVEGIHNILEFSFFPDISSLISQTNIYFWDGSKLIQVQTFENTFSATSVLNNSFIYPKDENGKEGVLIHCAKTAELDQNSGIFELTHLVETHYIWKDGKLQMIEK